MYRAHPFSQDTAIGLIATLLLVAAIVAVPAPLNAYEAPPVVVGGGGGGGIVPGTEGDPIDSNDYAGDDPIGSGDDEGNHEDFGGLDNAVVAPTPLPGFRIADRLTVYLVFDRVCGLPVLSFRFATAVTVRGE